MDKEQYHLLTIIKCFDREGLQCKNECSNKELCNGLKAVFNAGIERGRKLERLGIHGK